MNKRKRNQRRQEKKQQIADSRLRPRVQSSDLREQLEAHKLVAEKREFYQGMLPHPDHLAKFEEFCPGVTNRIMAMAEKEQSDANANVRRQFDLHEVGLRARIADNKRAQWLAAYALSACLVASVLLAYLHAYAASAGVGVTTVIGVVGSYIHGKHRRSKKIASDEKELSKPS